MRLGNFWVDLVRGLLYVLLPLGRVAGALLMIAGIALQLVALRGGRAGHRRGRHP